MRKLLIATQNPGKFEEYKIILKNLPIELVSLKDLNITEKIKEDGKTYQENARKKAKFYSRLRKLSTLGDDGGLEVDYLNGKPGMKSRRWPGHEATDEELIQMILDKMKGVPLKRRGAQFRAVIAFAFPGDLNVYTFEGILRGYITETAITQQIKGYPFRSVFYLPKQKQVFAVLSKEEEAEISHRKIAIGKATPLLKEKFQI